MNEAGHVVVTGGSGFVGGYLVRHLLDRGVGRITILDRVTPEIVDSRVVHVPGDIADGISWSPPTPVEAVYHLAAACREPGFTMEQYFRDNQEGTIALSMWLEAAKVRNVIFASTMMVYGAGDSRMTSPWADRKPGC